MLLARPLLHLKPAEIGMWQKCGAYARSTGKPCRAPGNGRGGRCKLHGGKSTGPRTEAGIRRLKKAVRRRWRAWRAAREEGLTEARDRLCATSQSSGTVAKRRKRPKSPTKTLSRS
jgi:hypothetical protein